MPFVKTFWKLLLSPFSSVKDPAERRIARLITTIHLSLLLLGVGCLIPFLIFRAAPELIIGTAKAVLLITFLYFLSRTPYFRYAAIVSLVYFVIQALYGIASTSQNIEPSWFILLTIPLLFTTVIASQRWTVFVAILSAVALSVRLLYSGIDSIIIVNALIGAFIVSLFIIIVDHHRRGLATLRLNTVIEGEKHLHDILETTFQAIITIQNGVIQDVNAGFAELFESAKLTAIGKNIDQYIKASDGESNVQLHLLQSGSTASIIGLQHDGAYFEGELVVQDRTYKGEAAKVLAIRDLTEQKKTADALQQAQRLDSLGVLAGGIAHDFNNLLTGIIAQISIAEAKIKSDKGALKHMQKSAESARRASDLTRQLLAYAGKGTIAPAAFDIQKLVRECVGLIQANLSSHITISSNLANMPLYIDADNGQIQQVILNLIINATQSIGNEGGEVIVTTRRYSAKVGGQKPVDDWVGDELQPISYIELCVEDNGLGMDQQTISRIFEPFFTTKDTGTGLGLAATMGVIHTHEGSIQVESIPTKGSQFYVYLPLVEHEQPIAKEEYRPIFHTESMAEHALTVLVIDDQDTIRDSIQSILEFEGNRVLMAESGEQGLSILWENRDEIDLIVLDMQMPVMNGEATFKEIRNLTAHLPVLLCSGYGESDAIGRITSCPHVSFLQKPYDAPTLTAAIEYALRPIPQTVA